LFFFFCFWLLQSKINKIQINIQLAVIARIFAAGLQSTQSSYSGLVVHDKPKTFARRLSGHVSLRLWDVITCDFPLGWPGFQIQFGFCLCVSRLCFSTSNRSTFPLLSPQSHGRDKYHVASLPLARVTKSFRSKI